MKKKIISILLTIVMLIGIIPSGGISVFAEEKTDNQYVVRSWDGTKVTEQFVDIPAATTVTSITTVWENGWYVADGTVDISSVRVGGNVNLILKGGCKLTVGGITVTGSDSLTIYAQKGGTGELISKASANNYAGIGGGPKDDGGIITIHGGKITATGGEMAAGIGGGFQGACGTVTIYGGEVTATGGFNGAGIGTGSAPRNNGGSIAIYGGKVTVSTSDNSAMGEQRPRAIGGGFNGSVDTITIGNIMEASDGSGNIVTAPSGEQTWADVLTGICYTFCLPVVEYQYYDEAQQKFFSGECDEYTVVTSDTTILTDGWYVVNDTVTIDEGVIISGNVNLILNDDKTLTATFITGNGSLSIYAQTMESNMGRLNVGTLEVGGDMMTIHGSNVTANILIAGGLTITGGSVTADYIKAVHSIKITGGTVKATGNEYGVSEYGISSDNDSVEILGGEVTAQGSKCGICSYGTMFIEDCCISATGGEYGIYSKTNIIIHGGDITASGGQYGICAETGNISIYGDGANVTGSGGQYGICSKTGITIRDGDVTAQGGEKAFSSKVVEVNSAMTVYTQANERIENPDWQGKYYRIIDEDLVVPYLYYDEESKELKQANCLDYEVIDTDHKPTEWEAGKWYVVKGDIGTGSVSVSGDVHLIFTDETKLTVVGSILGEDAHLYFHAQTENDTNERLICYGSGAPDYGIKGNAAINVTELTIFGASVYVRGGTGHFGISGMDGDDENNRTGRSRPGDPGSDGGEGILAETVTVVGAYVKAEGGVGGNGGKGGNGGENGRAGAAAGGAGTGGTAISAAKITVLNAAITATGGKGGEGGQGGSGLNPKTDEASSGSGGGYGGKGILATDIIVTDGIITAKGGEGGLGGFNGLGINFPNPFFPRNHINGGSNAGITLNEGGTIVGTVEVNEADSFIPLPSGESISNYRFAKITNTLHTHNFTGEYVSNGDGTYSKKCIECDEVDTENKITATDYHILNKTCDSNNGEGNMMGRQTKIDDESIGRVIIPVTEKQLEEIGDKLVIVGGDFEKETTVEIDCVYTYFYDGETKIEAKDITVNENGDKAYAFIIIDCDAERNPISGYGYYRFYNESISTENFLFDVIYADPKGYDY